MRWRRVRFPECESGGPRSPAWQVLVVAVVVVVELQPAVVAVVERWVGRLVAAGLAVWRLRQLMVAAVCPQVWRRAGPGWFA